MLEIGLVTFMQTQKLLTIESHFIAYHINKISIQLSYVQPASSVRDLLAANAFWKICVITSSPYCFERRRFSVFLFLGTKILAEIFTFFHQFQEAESQEKFFSKIQLYAAFCRDTIFVGGIDFPRST